MRRAIKVVLFWWPAMTPNTKLTWAASKVKDSAYSAIYSNLVKRRGKKRVAYLH